MIALLAAFLFLILSTVALAAVACRWARNEPCGAPDGLSGSRPWWAR